MDYVFGSALGALRILSLHSDSTRICLLADRHVCCTSLRSVIKFRQINWVDIITARIFLNKLWKYDTMYIGCIVVTN